MPTPSEYITQIYAGYYNRAPDPAGLNYWVGRFNAGMSLLDIAQSFSVQPETVALYSFLTNGGSPAAFLNSIYNNLLARAPDALGAAYWTTQLASNMPVGRIIIDIISGAQGNDILLINNKVAVGQHFVNELQRLNLPFSMELAQSAFTGVTSDAATISMANSTINMEFSRGTVNIPATIFTLTTGLDNFTGGSGRDSFNAMVDSDAGSGQTLTVGDTINGSGVNDGDVFNIRFNPASTVSMPAATIRNVEIFNLTNVSGKTLMFDSSLIPGKLLVSSDYSTSDITITNLSAGSKVSISGNGVSTSGNVNIGYAQVGVAGDLTLMGVAGGALLSGRVTFTSSPLSVKVNTFLFPNSIAQLDLGDAAQSLTIFAGSALEFFFGIDAPNLKTITISGSAINPGPEDMAIYLGFPLASTIDASAMTAGGVEAYLSAVKAAASTLKGGGGSDILGASAGSDTFTGGGGADRFEFYGNDLAATASMPFGGVDIITDFTLGTDLITFGNVNEVLSLQQAAIRTAVIALPPGSSETQIASVMATLNTTNRGVSTAPFGGDTYVFYEVTGAGNGLEGNDVFIKLAGVNIELLFP